MDMSKGFPGGLGERMGSIEGIYASEFTYKTQSGQIFPDTVGLCDPQKGQIILNSANLSKELKEFEDKYNKMSPSEKETYKDLHSKLTELSKEKYGDVLYQMIFHLVDFNMSPDRNKYRFLSETEHSPFLEEIAHSITPYAKKAALSWISAAETFRELMRKKIKLGADFNEKTFAENLKDSPYWKQYKFIMDKYLADSKGNVKW